MTPAALRRCRLLAGAVFLGLLAAPFLAGYARQDGLWVFSGIPHLAADNNAYLAWAKQAQQGRLLFWMAYSSEPQPRVLLLPFFWLVGTAARLSRVPLRVAMNAAQGAGALFFMLSLDRWLRGTVESEAERTAAFAAVLLAGGSGAVWERLFPSPAGTSFLKGPVDLWAFGLGAFNSGLHSPIGLLSLGLLFLALSLGDEGRPAASAAANGILFLVHPYTGLIAWALQAACAWRDGRWKGRALAAALSAPALLYMALVPRLNPVLSAYGHSLRNFNPSPAAWAEGLWPLWLLSVPGTVAAARSGSRALWPVALWAWGGTLALLPGPFLTQEWLQGLHIAWCVLAVHGVFALKGRRWMRAAGAALLAATASSNVRLWKEDVSDASELCAPAFLPRPLVDALHAAETSLPPDGVVLAPASVGLFVPPWTGRRTFIGHWDQTVDLARKEGEASWFFSPAASDRARRRFLEARGIGAVLLTPSVTAGQRERWARSPWLAPLFDDGSFALYRVVPGTGEGAP